MSFVKTLLQFVCFLSAGTRAGVFSAGLLGKDGDFLGCGEIMDSSWVAMTARSSVFRNNDCSVSFCSGYRGFVEEEGDVGILLLFL